MRNLVKSIVTKKKMIDTTIGNALGLQVVREIGARTLLNIRRKRCPQRQMPEVQELIDRGCCVIPDFLSASALEAVRAEFKEAMDRFLRTLRNTPSAPGQDRVLFPGLPEAEAELDRRANGIPLHQDVVTWLRDLCGELGVGCQV